MEKESNREPYVFGKDFKNLPVKKRVSLIKIARTLLFFQKESNTLLWKNMTVCQSREEEK